MIKVANSMNVPIAGIVLNMVTKKRKIKVEKIEEFCGIKVLSIIPYDKRIPETISEMKPIVLYRPNSRIAKAFKELAAKLIGEAYIQEGFLIKLKKWLFAKWSKRSK